MIQSAARTESHPPPPAFSWKKLSAQSWRNWNAIDAPRLGAALAYYALLSLAPLLVLIVSIAGVLFRRALIRSGLLWQVRNLMGSVGAAIVRPVLQNSQSTTGIVAGILGALTLLLGASAVFLELRDSLDLVWGVKPPYGSGLRSLVKERLFAFLLVLGAGLLVSASLLLTTILGTPARLLLHYMPDSGIIDATLATVVSIVVMTVVFALIYKVIPDVYIRWGDVWTGALVTSILFTAGKWLIALYLAKAGVGSLYAAAGSLVVFLTWVYYSVQIFLLGAEFTHEYAFRHGSYARPGRPPADSGSSAARPPGEPLRNCRRSPAGRCSEIHRHPAPRSLIWYKACHSGEECIGKIRRRLYRRA